MRLCQVLSRLLGSVAWVRLQSMLFDVYRKLGRTFDHVVDHCLAIELGQRENAVLSQFIFENRGHDRYDAHSPSSIPGAPCKELRRVAQSSLSPAWRNGSGVPPTSQTASISRRTAYASQSIWSRGSSQYWDADSDEVAQAYRYEVARGFRDDVAHLSDLISPSGEAFWPAGSLASVKPRGQSGIATSTFFLLLRLLWACGQRDCVVQAQRHVHGAQVFRADCRVRRRLSPVRSSRWALWTRRSSTASA